MTDMPPTDAAPEPHQGNIRLIIASIATLMLLAALDQTIVSTALPTIVADLGGVEHLSWVVTAYFLTSTIVAPLYGKLGDLYGRRNMVFISVTLFLIGSVLCGMANSMLFLILARALQGLGGGGIFVLVLSVIGDVIAPKDRGKFQGVFAAVFSISSVIGPLIGGGLVEIVSWHWIFYINLPIGLLAVLGFAAAFKPTGRRKKHRIDWEGAISLSILLTGVVLLTSLGGREFAWLSMPAFVLGAAILLGLAGFIWSESRAAEPIIPLGLFRQNVFVVTSMIGMIGGAAMFGAITFMPMYLQVAKGVSPTISGLQLLPMTLGIMISSQLAGRYMGRTGRYFILPLIGLTSLMVGMLLLSTLTATTPYWMTAIFILFVGLGMGQIFPVVTTAVQNSVAREVMGTATAAGIMFRQIGGAVGTAVFGAIFAARLTASIGENAPAGITGEGFDPAVLASLPAEVRDRMAEIVTHALHPNYLIGAALAFTGILIATRLKETKLRGRGPEPEAQPAE
ncbi:MDR family MFS transporter [Pseudoroseicyclus sp. CXY001]|uniref:MDR family MFS transporter n=1 Tax=Pseudoroseicyclus sp. CXY001 TaxID=3242492 RepID=UPI00358DC9D9